jgi:hypothetical protein
VRSFLATLLAACGLALAGCGTTITAPPLAPQTRPVYVTNYGRHSSVLLTDSTGVLTEFAFGDYRWFAISDTTSGAGVQAMLHSAKSTLARRTLRPESSDIDAVARATRAAHVGGFNAPADRVDALLARLNVRFEQRVNEVTYNPRSSMWFVPDAERYSFFHNCNHVTAGWLRSLGCDVKGPAMFSNFKLVAPPPTPPPPPPPPPPTTASSSVP